MPALIEWMMHYPADWTPVQARAYASHTLQQLTVGLRQPLEALGPSVVSSVLCTMIALIAQANPLAARDICNSLANAFDSIENIDPLKGATQQ